MTKVLLGFLLALLLAGCATGPQVVKIPAVEFAYALGAQTQRLDAACKRKEISAADCTALRRDAARARALLSAPQKGTDWAALLDVLIGLAAKAAL